MRGPLVSWDSTHPLLAGDYEIVAAFANPNYQESTEVSFGTVTVTGGETATLELGVMTFNVADSLKGIPVDAVNVYRKGAPDPLLTLHHHGNGCYLFKPKPLPLGAYSLSFAYSRSPGPTAVAHDITIETGRESIVTIDSGIGLQKPTGKDVNVQGWNLVPAGGETPALQVRRRWDNNYPLWKVFAVPPGTYDLSVLLKGMEGPLPVGKGLSISKGGLLMLRLGVVRSGAM